MGYNRKRFFDIVRALYPKGYKQSQVDGLEFLLGKFEKDRRYQDTRLVSYGLATVKRECGDTYQPIVERGPKAYFNKYNNREDLGNGPKDGFLFRGRGYSMITGRRNYTLFGERLGMDLVAEPERVLEPNIAYEILALGMDEGLFTGKAIGRYITSKSTDYYNARRVINGTDHAQEIADAAIVFQRALLG